MTERNGRDADLDPQRANPRVVPIRGFTLPAPPGWDTTDEAISARASASAVLTPEDYTVQGALRCTYLTQSNGGRCNNALVAGTTGCGFHNARYAHYHNYTAEGVPHPDDPSEPSKAQESRAERVDRIRAHLELAGSAAVLAVQAILEDEMAKPSDRLKAAEIVLDRTVGRQIQVEREADAERELDVEILELADNLLPPTGTDGSDGGGLAPPTGSR